MKKTILAIILVLAMAVTGSAQMKPAIYVGGGVAMPMSPEIFKEGWKMGFGGMAGVGFQINPMFEVGARFAYSTQGLDAEGDFSGGSFSEMEMVADVKLFIPMGAEDAPFKPYIGGNVGMITAKLSEFTAGLITVPSVSETKMGFGFGAGFVFDASPSMGIFVEAKYMMVATEGESTGYLPIRAGIKFSLGGGGE